MTQTRRRFIQIVAIAAMVAAIVAFCLVLAAFLSRSRPVFVSLGNNVRDHHGIQLLNPFRQRTAEKAADAFLTRFTNGECWTVLSELGEEPDRKAAICEGELRLPLRSWRLEARGEDGAKIVLRYRVSRVDGGQTIHDPFWIWVSQSNGNGYHVSGYEPWY
jgi:hypothetical protein